MENIINDIKNTNKVFLITGDRWYNRDFIVSKCREGATVKLYDIASLGIDDAINIRNELSKRTNGQRVVVISFFIAGIEAQNALLKSLEEEHTQTSIVLVTQDEGLLLPTVLSRTMSFHSAHKEEYYQKERENYLVSSPKKRIETGIVAKFIDKEETEAKYDREHAYIFFDQLLTESYKNNKTPEKILELGKALEVLNLLKIPSASIKNICEYMSLWLPQTK